jgi:branched-chain amino acid transport system permease protein
VVSVPTLIQLFLSGLLMGGVLALIAVGLTLVYGVLHIINLSHGALVVLGGFIGFWGWEIFGINPYLMILPVFALMFLVGLPIKRGLISPIQDTELLNQLLLTFGLTLAIEALMAIVWTPSQRFISWPPLLGRVTIPLWSIQLPYNRLIAFVGSLLIFAVLYLFLYRTKLGRGIRATADSKETASIVGVNIERIELLVFSLGTGLAGVGGLFLITIVPLNPYSGIQYVLLAFVIVTLGGMGSVMGSLVGGLLIGIVRSVSVIWISTTEATALIYFLLLVAFIIKPQGLFGRAQTELET